METKPIVTCHGNQVLFSSLHKAVLESLPKESAEWRRSYGRQARSVNLEASFVPYDDDILPEETDKTLISRPYFHIYWTECDLETYKQKVKEEVSDWSAALKGKTIPDWLIVVVNSDENKVKSKLLPRSSVYDKIKSDFCSKQPDRIVVLTDPLKSEPKSVETWNVFVSKLRNLLLQAFTKHLQKYEDNMRALREKRNEIGWNFQQYFIVQEELAFMFEMLGLHDDAMIQYDELDALFTQFVLNHASGRMGDLAATYKSNKPLTEEVHPLIVQQLTSQKCINLESVSWLKSLVKSCKCWAGLSLKKSISWDRRNMIRDENASLLVFRNYLFSRQCALLFLMKRPGEIVQRAIDYLHETVNEMKTLAIDIEVGGLDCWVFLSGLEVLQRCENLTDSTQTRAHSLNTAYLWDYVCRKLRELGELCGLMPDSQLPSSQQLALVVDLTSGMGLEAVDDDDDDDNKTKIKPSPLDKLREALSSRESFQRVYLEQSELAMGTFKHIGRFRSARMIGKNLADFYMKLGEPQKAENFLLDAMSGYHKEGWKKLRDVARLELATCQLQVADPNKYVKTGCQVVSSCLLEMKDRTFHMTQVLEIANTTSDGPILLKASPLLEIEVTQISASKVTIDKQFQITMEIENNAPCDITCDTIWLTFTDCVPESVATNPHLEKIKTPLSRQASNSSLEGRNVMNLAPVKKMIPSAINLRIHYEGSPASPVSTGLACVNSHELLSRIDSSGSSMKVIEEKMTKDTFSQTVSVDNVVLKPGENSIQLTCEGIAAGHYKPGQACVKVNQLEFIKDMTSDLTVTVMCDKTYCDILPDNLIAGAQQSVKVCLHTGSTPIDLGSKVKVMPSDDLAIETDSADNTIMLETAARGSCVEWTMLLSREPCVTGKKTIEDKIAFDCSWLPFPLLTTVSFQNPFHVSHKVHTAREMKYIQLMVQGHCEPEFLMTDWTLDTTNTNDVELIRLNKSGQKLKVNVQQSASCMWQIKSNIAEFPPLDLIFTMKYRCIQADDDDGNNERKQLVYHFSLCNFQTLLSVNADITPGDEEKVCKTGSLAWLKIKVVQLPEVKPLPDQEYMYEVINKSNWSIHGKSTGIFSLNNGMYTTSIEILPLVTGFIPLPRIQLYKYSGASSEKDIWNKKADLEQYETIDSTDEDSSESETDHLAIPNQVEFDQGQVYYSSLGKQVHVYPKHTSGDIEVTVIQ